MNDSNSPLLEQLSAQIKQHELEKLQLETKELKRRWFQKPTMWLAAFPSLVTAILLILGFKIELLDYETKIYDKKARALESNLETLKTKEKDYVKRTEELSTKEAQYKTDAEELARKWQDYENEKNEFVLAQAEFQREVTLAPIKNVMSFLHQYADSWSLGLDDREKLEDLLEITDPEVSAYVDNVISQTLSSDETSDVVKMLIYGVIVDVDYSFEALKELVVLHNKIYPNIHFLTYDVFPSIYSYKNAGEAEFAIRAVLNNMGDYKSHFKSAIYTMAFLSDHVKSYRGTYTHPPRGFSQAFYDEVAGKIDIVAKAIYPLALSALRSKYESDSEWHEIVNLVLGIESLIGSTARLGSPVSIEILKNTFEENIIEWKRFGMYSQSKSINQFVLPTLEMNCELPDLPILDHNDDIHDDSVVSQRKNDLRQWFNNACVKELYDSL